MKALAIHQPYAWLIIQGIKDVENRTWPTNHQDFFYIHATMAKDVELPAWQRAELDRKGMVLPTDLPHGGIIGKVRLEKCVERVDLSWWRRIRCRLLGKGCIDQPDSIWFEGPYGFILRDAQPLPFVPYRGQQKFFNVPDDLYGSELGN